MISGRADRRLVIQWLRTKSLLGLGADSGPAKSVTVTNQNLEFVESLFDGCAGKGQPEERRRQRSRSSDLASGAMCHQDERDSDSRFDDSSKKLLNASDVERSRCTLGWPVQQWQAKWVNRSRKRLASRRQSKIW